MATKMCFFVGSNTAFEERIVEFEYVKGLAFSQKQKNVLSFHKSIKEQFPNVKILEVSTKSDTPLGVKLSAFNLTLGGYPLECVFQSSKVFEGEVSFPHLLCEEPRAAKQYIRESVTLPLVGFSYRGERFDLLPRSMFYDYLYVTALKESGLDLAELTDYDVFTDIEFNEKKAYNCQARSCAIYAYMLRTDTLEYHTSSRDRFRELYGKAKIEQLTLL